MMRRDLFKLLAETSHLFITDAGRHLDDCINATLERISRAFAVDRAYLFQVDMLSATVSNTHEWCAEGIEPVIDELQGIPFEGARWWMSQMHANLPINLAGLDELPADAEFERQILEPQGIRSLLVLPLFDRQRLVGFAGLDHVRSERVWSADEIDVLQVVVSTFTHGFARKAMDERLELAVTVFQNSDESIFVTDDKRRILTVNPMFSTLTGYSAEEVMGSVPDFLAAETSDDMTRAEIWETCRRSGAWRGQIWNRRKDGSAYLARLTLSTVTSRNGLGERFVGVFSDVTLVHEQAQRLAHLAFHDALTRLPNRNLLRERMDRELKLARRAEIGLAVCYLDLDTFKVLNDRFGHEYGDELLIEMGRRMHGTLRAHDTVARLGGDEFVLVLPGVRSRADAEVWINRILASLSLPYPTPDGGEIRMTASLGVRFVLPGEKITDTDMLLRQADQAMYNAKQDGGGRAHFFDTARDLEVTLRKDSVARVMRAIAAGEMTLQFQPIVHLATGQLSFAEALVRWQHPERGLLPPAAWIPGIEHSPAIDALGIWVMEKALEQAAEWSRVGIDAGVSVNVSGHQLRDPSFVDAVRLALARYPELAPSKLKVEVLESAAFVEFDAVLSTIQGCRALGVEVALDDFGTGYSSLTLLKQLPASSLKIDRSFVSGMLQNSGDMEIVRGVIELARAFGRTSIAEGVETPEVAEALHALGCDFVQGYVYSPPLWVDDFKRWSTARVAIPTRTDAKP